MGDDVNDDTPGIYSLSFYPRPPYGGRLDAALDKLTDAEFLSTSPVWGTGDPHDRTAYDAARVSIHVPRMGDVADRGVNLPETESEFLSTSPVWGTKPS